MKIRVKDIYDKIDAPIIMCDNDGHDYTLAECSNMEILSIQVCGENIMVIVDKFSVCD